MSRMKSVMSHSFSNVPKVQIQRSTFDRSHGYKTTFDAGKLIPFYVDEVLPGDTHKLGLNAFARMATPLKPIMDNMFMDFHFFFVPNRLLWSNWEKFQGEQEDPGDSIDYLVPQITCRAGGYEFGSIYDYMGIRPETEGLNVNALHMRAYNQIFNEWFRDQNLQDSVTVNRGDGPDAFTDYEILNRGKRHDYFTSCLPFPQKGDAVDLPLGDTAPIVGSTYTSTAISRVLNADPVYWFKDGTNNRAEDGTDIDIGLDGLNAVLRDPDNAGLSLDPNGQLQYDLDPSATDWEVDLSSATASTINALRQSFALQRILEKDARGGTRYTEILRSQFGVISPDSRLQRPELLATGSRLINVNPIAQTSETPTSGTPQGNLAAIGTMSTSGDIGFMKSFTEHGVILGFVSVRADLTYQQGTNKMWSRRTRYDFYMPSLAHLGEQAVLNKEIFTQDDTILGGSGDPVNEEVFGYQERWAEYRYKPSMITGKFRSDDPQSLDVWHLSQDFASLPVLNDEFIQEDPPVDRIIAVPSEPQFIFDAYIDLKSTRPMPVYSVPGYIDHF